MITGGGIKWDINHKLSVNIEASYRFIFTDYLDDVSTVYPNIGELRSIRGEEGVMLSDRSEFRDLPFRANKEETAGIMTNILFGASLMYYFGKLDCPEVNRFSFK